MNETLVEINVNKSALLSKYFTGRALLNLLLFGLKYVLKKGKYYETPERDSNS